MVKEKDLVSNLSTREVDACLKVLQRERAARGVDGGLEPIPQVGVQSPPRPIEVLNSMAPSTSQAPGVVPSCLAVSFRSRERHTSRTLD